MFGHDDALVGHTGEYLTGLYGAALADIEGVGERFVASFVLHEVFKHGPVGTVEVAVLWRHIGHIERLVVAFAREEAVG